mgnify:CR=1 FL=1
MEVSIVKIVVWIIVGALAGSLVGLAVTRKRQGFGRLANLGLGLVGALIGGFLFDVLRIDLGLASVSVSLHDLVAAFVGSLLFLAALTFARRRYAKSVATQAPPTGGRG